ncbi:PAS domain S-box protein [Priestia megaterium]|uniref:PAS domain S-box protein n=1 Tax=Priestia megaterium TaxID=1404 RepID=UPI002079E04F|nr:PAS domain S-box protein [Priestia megaterium]USL44788.1 PAS domain S-box protein [Priestia megaterium]
MISSGLFVNLCIFSFLVSIMIAIRIFLLQRLAQKYKLVSGIYASIVSAILMVYSVTYQEVTYDLRFLPLILTLLYFGYRAGAIAGISMAVCSIYLESHWILTILILIFTFLLSLPLIRYRKQFSFSKQSFLYFFIHFIVHVLLTNYFWNTPIRSPFYTELEYFLFGILGLGVGVATIEFYRKFYAVAEEAAYAASDSCKEREDSIFVRIIKKELEYTKEQLESFINHHMDAVIITDLEGRILRVNEAYEKVYGWKAHEVIGKKYYDIAGAFSEDVSENIKKTVAKKEAINRVEVVRARKDGSLVDLRITISPIFNGKDELIGLSGVCVDISEAKKARIELDLLHRKLKESELKYRTLFEYANDAIYLLEIGSNHFPSRFVEVNEAGCKRFGYTREELLSMPCQDIIPRDSDIVQKTVEEIRKGNLSFTLQSQFTFKSGEVKKLEYSGKLFNIENKKVLLIVSRDRTEYLKTEELLQKSEKLAAVGQLATAIAHEIRNPLTAIKGFVQLLTEKASKEELIYMNIISSEIERIEMITDEFMSVAKPQAVTFQSIDLQLLIQQVILLLQPQATMKNIFIELNLYGEMPFVYCESNQMKQVFINILKNAIEAMPSGGEIRVELRKKDNNHIHIQIIDEGVGISKERIKHLGEPFYSIKEDGIGLGLMICFNIIQQHKGTLSIESEVNKGTSVEICLPLE